MSQTEAQNGRPGARLPSRVRVKSAGMRDINLWYSNNIGSEYDVLGEYASDRWKVANPINTHDPDGWSVIWKSDAEPIYDEPEASPLTQQVGGEHYKNLAIQPAEYTTRNGIGHLAGDAIAYITRYRAKNGKQDLEKAIHSLQLLIALEYPKTEEVGR